MNIIIDLSTPGSGGAKRHIIELLKASNPSIHGFSKITVFSVNTLLNELPNYSWISKETSFLLNWNWFGRMLWRTFIRNIVFNTDNSIVFSPVASFSSRKTPFISMCRNMLIFDEKQRNSYSVFSLMYWRLCLMFFVQRNSFKNANGVIFISEYAMRVVSDMFNLATQKISIIHHGVSSRFKSIDRNIKDLSSYSSENPFVLLYVSSVWKYKNHLNVLKSVVDLKTKGYPLKLIFVGKDDESKISRLLEKEIFSLKGKLEVEWHKNVSLDEVANFYSIADLFVFASSCENMPNILIEAMSAGLPIACSKSQPMPEFLSTSGIYFDEENIISISNSIEKLILDTDLRRSLSDSVRIASENYSWIKCANETFSFIKYNFDNACK